MLGSVDSAVPRRLVPAGGAADRLDDERTLPHGLSSRALGFATAALPVGRAGAALPVDARACSPRAASRGSKAAQLVALWGSDDRDRDRGYTLSVVRRRTPTASSCSSTRCPTATRRTPISSTVFPAANRMQRAAFDLVGIASEADDQRPWVWQASWPIDRFPLRRDFEALAEMAAGPGGVRVRARRGRRRARDSRRARARRHHRAGALPLPGRRRESAAPGGAARLRRTRASRSDSRRWPPPTGHRLAGRVSGDSTVAYAWAYAQALEAIAETRAAAARAVAARARARARAHRQSPGRSRLSRQRRRVRVRPRAVLAAEGGRAAHESRARSAIGSRWTTSCRAASRATSRRSRRRAIARRMRRCSSARSACCATSTTSTTACRIASAPAAS